jgi:hypothetical protein
MLELPLHAGLAQEAPAQVGVSVVGDVHALHGHVAQHAQIARHHDLPRPPLLQPTVETAARPASQVETGGALQDGDYLTTRVTIYSVPPPLTGAFGATMLGALMRVRAGVMESILLSDDGEGSGPVEQRTREAIKVEGNKLQLTLICPSGGGPEEGLYTTDGRTLRLSQVVDGIEIVFELARR